MTCGFCGNPITGGCVTFKGVIYHAVQGMTTDGKLIYVERAANCFEQSDMGTKSLCGQFPPTIMVDHSKFDYE